MKRFLFALVLLLTLGAAFAATPNPGHDASRIGAGTFPSGTFIFPETVQINGTTFYVNGATNRVGIGTVAPATPLDVVGGITSTNGSILATPKTPTFSARNASSGFMNGADSIAIQGRYAYVTAATNDSLTILDIGDPTYITRVGAIGGTTYFNGASGIVVNGKYAYIAAQNANRLTIVDVSDPSTPVVVGSVSSASQLEDIRNIVLVGKYIFAGARTDDRITVIDVSNPTAPTIVGSSAVDTTNSNDPWAIAVQGKYAYVASRLVADGNTTATLTVFDVSDPTNISRVSTVTSSTANDSRGIHVTGRYAYISGYTSDSIAVFDISNPAAPVEISSLVDSTYLVDVWDIFVAGKYLYATSESGDRFTIVDVSDPRAPSVHTSFTSALLDGARRFIVSGRYAYVATNVDDGMSVLDIGSEVPTLYAGSLTTSSLVVEDDTNLGNNLLVGGGINVGGNIVIRNGLTTYYESAAGTAGTEYGTSIVVKDNGTISTGTDTTYGLYGSITRTGATGGTLATYGGYYTAVGDTGGTSTATGLYAAASGADTNYAAILNGVVGVNTTTPTFTLHVDGSANISTSTYTPQLCLNGDCRTAWPDSASSAGGWSNTSTLVSLTNTANNISANTLFVDNTNGRVGINDTTPFALFTVGSDDKFYIDNEGLVTIANNQSQEEIRFIGEFASNIHTQGSLIFRIDSNNDSSNTFTLRNGTDQTIVEIDEAGNLGLGITSPSNRLHVSGTANISSTLWVGSTLTGANGLTISAGTVSLPAGEIGGAEIASSAINSTKLLTSNTPSADQILAYNATSGGFYWATDQTGGAANDLTCADCVALGSETSGNYAAGDAEGGAALTGDSATAFFSAGLIEMARGGTNSSLTASNGGIIYSNASGMAVLSGTATAGQILRSGSSAAPSWTTATYPATTTINQLLYSSAANTVTGLTTANSAVLVTNSSGTPSLATDIPTAVTIGSAYIYRVGGTDVSLADGGTGASLADPNADRIMFWDDSASATAYLTPGTGLSISGTTISASSNLTSTNGTVNYIPRFSNGTNLVTGALYDNGTHVGLGTIGPASNLHVVGTANVSSTLLVGGAATVATINTGSGAMELGDAAVANGDTDSIPTNDQVYDFVTGLGLGSGNITGNGSTNHVAYWTAGGAIGYDSSQLYWDATNNRLGIGSASPTQALHVVGSANITANVYYGGNLTGTGADFAERFTVAEKLEFGDVVCLRSDQKIERCENRAQKTVVGVVSTSPTIIGNADAPDSVAVGIVGIVPTKVTGRVQRGDLLTTSSRDGYAEKASQADFGAIIGKAMESCSSECAIDVLVGLR